MPLVVNLNPIIFQHCMDCFQFGCDTNTTEPVNINKKN